jgi:uncharacterized damage-inducible protein DinB
VEYTLNDAALLLARTPSVVRAMLADLPADWSASTEGPGTWSPFDVVGHLIHAERTDWIPRVEHLLEHGESRPFPPFDREAMFEASRGASLNQLLTTFEQLRAESLARLAELGVSESDLGRRGTHPEFGSVTLRQHLATWVVHDFTHIGQVARVLAKQYGDAVGPWRAYLSILRTV